MHARVTTLTMDPDRIGEVVDHLEHEDVPLFKKLDGFKGMSVMADRASGKAVAVTFWESEEALRASEGAVAPARERAARAGGAPAPAVERFEVLLDTMA